MKVLLFGATGMVGQGVLRECLLDPDVEQVLSVGRTALGQRHEKLEELLVPDLLDLSKLEERLVGLDACFYCLGISSVGVSEADYRRVTVDMPLAAARALGRTSPGVTFVYVSGAGTDAKSRTMWKRVKGEAEEALLAAPLRAAYMLRPAGIQPRHGIRSKTALYQAVYTVTGPLLPALRAAFPRYVTSTDAVGRAMLALARRGAPKRILENDDVEALARGELRVAAGAGGQ